MSSTIVGMTPIEEERIVLRRWKCRHCKHKWPITNPAAIADETLRPKQCPNRECRAADWDRDKIKEGRPRGSKAKTQRSKHGRGRK